MSPVETVLWLVFGIMVGAMIMVELRGKWW